MTLYVFVYRQSEQAISQKELEKAERGLQTAAEYIDRDFLNAYNALGAVARDPDVIRLYEAYDPLRVHMHGKMLLAKKSLSALMQSTDVVADSAIILVSSDSASLITPTYILYDMQSAERMNLLSLGALGEGTLPDSLKRRADSKLIKDGFSPAADIRLVDRQYNAIPYVRHLTPMMPKAGGVALYGLLTLNTKSVYALMFPENDGTVLCGVTQNGRVMWGDVPADPQAGDYHTIRSVSTLTQFEYSLSIPDSYFTGRLGYMSLYYNVSLFFIVFVLFPLLMILYIIKPLNRLLTRFDHAAQGEGLFAALSNGIDRLFIDNRAMRSKLDAWLPVVKTELIGRLLSGYSLSAEELEVVSQLKAAPGCRYRVMVFTLVDHNGSRSLLSREACLDALLQTVSQAFAKTVLYPVDRWRYALIVNFGPEVTREVFRERLSQALGALDERGHVFQAGIGQSVEALDDISLSYEKALEASACAQSRSMLAMMWYDEIVDAVSKPYYFAYNSVEKIYSTLLAGDGKAAVEVLRQVLKQNLGGEASLYDQDLMTQLFYDFQGILLRISVRVDIAEVLAEIPRQYAAAEMTVDAFRDMWVRLFGLTADKTAELNNKNSLIGQVLQYIDANYTDCNMSLKMIANHFRISDKYLSARFKEITGSNFFAYLEERRMKHAEALMKLQTMTINDISSAVGYATPSTFYKAFKRRYGTTPTGYYKQSGDDDDGQA